MIPFPTKSPNLKSYKYRMRTKRKATPIGRVDIFVKEGRFQEYAETNYEELFNKNSSDENFILTLFSAATTKLKGIYWEPIEKEWLISKLIYLVGMLHISMVHICI